MGRADHGDGDGDEPMPLSATVDAMERMHDYEDLDRAMRGDYPGSTVDDVDEEALRGSWVSRPSATSAGSRRSSGRLEKAGLVTRKNGRLEVTPRGARKLGERALVQVFEELKRDREGTHEARDAGGRRSRPARPGRGGSATRARSPCSGRCSTRSCAPGRVSRVRLQPDDFELVEAEQRTEAATALLLDLSFSMPLRGHFVHAKKMALALHALIEGRYPHDTLYLIGFSDYARRLQPEDLTAPGFERVYGTNMQHAFLLAGRLLSQHPRAARQVIMVTDGEPTAHLEGDQAFFSWPPVPKTIKLTLAEADAAVEGGRHAERVHARGVGGPDRLHGTARPHHVRAGVPDG